MLTITVARKLGGIKATVAPNLRTVEFEGGLGRGLLEWESLRPDNFTAKQVAVYSASPALARRCGVRAGQRIYFPLADDDREHLQEYARVLFTRFDESITKGEVRIVIVKVGVDNPRLVPRPSCSEWGGFDAFHLFYHHAEPLGMECWIPQGASEGEDITAAFVAEYLRRRALHDQPRQQRTVRCWECGREYTLEEAERLLKSGVAREDVGFYCGC